MDYENVSTWVGSYRRDWYLHPHNFAPLYIRMQPIILYIWKYITFLVETRFYSMYTSQLETSLCTPYTIAGPEIILQKDGG